MRLIGLVYCIFVRCATFATMAAAGLLLSACATMFADTDQVIAVFPSQKAVDGAQAVVTTSSGTQSVQLPTLIGTRSGSGRVSVRLQDKRYHPAEVQVERSVRGVYWLNFLNFYGFFIDYTTGAMWIYDEEVVVPTDPKG